MVQAAVLDDKQNVRSRAFEHNRQEYYAYVEGLVESEEQMLKDWLLQWARVPSESSAVVTEEERTASRRGRYLAVEKNLQAGVFLNGDDEDNGHLDVGVETGPETSDGGMMSDEGGSISASGGSGFSQKHTQDRVKPSIPPRKRRSSVPAFGLEKEKTSERIKGFLKTSFSNAQTSIQSALPMPSNHIQSSSGGDAPSSTSHSLRVESAPPSPALNNAPSPQLSAEPFLISKQTAAINARKKEGFLWATTKGTGSATTDSPGSGQWHKYVFVYIPWLLLVLLKLRNLQMLDSVERREARGIHELENFTLRTKLSYRSAHSNYACLSTHRYRAPLLFPRDHSQHQTYLSGYEPRRSYGMDRGYFEKHRKPPERVRFPKHSFRNGPP